MIKRFGSGGMFVDLVSICCVENVLNSGELYSGGDLVVFVRVGFWLI